MNLVFELTNHKGWKSVLVESDRLLLISKRYHTPDEFLEAYNDQGMYRLLKERKEILLIDIAGMSHVESNANELIISKHNGKKTTLEFAHANDLAGTASFIAGQKKLSRRVEKLSMWGGIKSPAFGLGLTLVIGWLLFTYADAIARTGGVERERRTRWLTELLIALAGWLGKPGTLLLTGGVAALFLFFILRRIKTPPNQVVYA